MENKKLDLNTIIGFLLIGGILIWMLSIEKNKPVPADKETNTEQVAPNSTDETTTSSPSEKTPVAQSDSLAQQASANSLGTFAYAATLPSATDKLTTIENDVLQLKISNRGGQIVEARLKNFQTKSSEPLFLIKDGNASFGLTLTTKNGKTVHTKDLYFQPTLSNDGRSLSMKLKISEDDYLEYHYSLRPDEYMLDFVVQSRGLNDLITPEPATLTWNLKTLISDPQSISYEKRYTEITYGYEDGKDDYTGSGEEEDKEIGYVAFKQHLFTSILLADQPFASGKFTAENLVKDEAVDTTYMKAFTAELSLDTKAGEFNKSMNWYLGPTDYDILAGYDRNLDEIISLGWGIFGWINKFLLIPFFGFLISFLPAGLAIIFLTVSIKLLLSPVQYKQYLSQAKMKVLKPEIEELSKKYKDNAMKKQQETMKLYNKAGASPMAGCVPALIQMPILYAMFMFFPSLFVLRNKSFLWVDDLSSFDVIAHLPFNIPFYGDHVSLFPILASVAIFFSMKLTTGNNMANSQPTQEGMPDMGKMMKYMMYLSPIFMLFFFNNYPSGLSLYYFISNTITIGIILVIKNYIIDEEKIHAKIEENKKKPKKQGKFARKMAEMMEQAEEQKKQRKK